MQVRVGCPAHNCGGRCVLVADVRDGRIVRLDADDRPDDLAAPQLRACVRGRAYLRRQYHADRLLHPLKRTGPRGAGRFERIAWDDALDIVARQIERVRGRHGSSALFVPYGTGSYNQLNGSHVARRLMNLSGGCLGIYNSYSWGAINLATPTVYGTLVTGNQRQDWLNSRYILMWGWNPAEMRDGTNSDYFIKLARERGARTVCIDPRHSLSAAALADEWIAIRPGTDAAMMSAMAFVIITEGLHDAEFVRTHCVGFDATQMPPGAEGAESYAEYLLGTRDGVPRTPGWAEPITGVPAATIARIAREYATTKPAVLYQGYGMQRRAYGEQVVRAGCVLAAITGNVGVPGGWASGLGLQAPDGGPLWTVFPAGENPVPAQIPVFLWSEAVLRGTSMTAADGVRGVDRLDNDIKLIYAVATNCLINQHADTNRSAEILRDESRVEFLVAQDNFLTPTARFADIVLPACTQFETWGVEDGWKYGDEVIVQPKLVDPPGECRSDYRICAGIAERLGIGEAFTQGRDERAWAEWCLDELRRRRFPELPAMETLLETNAGVWTRRVDTPAVAFADFRRDPERYPLATPTGKIEIFSKQLFDLGRADEIPAVPKYIPEWESPFTGDGGAERTEHPLQAIGHHTLHRVHSTHDNNDWLEEAFPQRVFMNPIDASARGIADGDEVQVFNGRGALVLRCRVTPRIMPGVIDVPQGAWWAPGEDGVDYGGNVNVLTSARWTPFAFATAQHTIMVDVQRLGRRSAKRDARPHWRRGARREGGLARRSAKREGGPVRYAFAFDASACTGCKACQVACKDKNALPEGVLWRRVYEVAGGTWERRGTAWTNTVFAYNMSVGCNHCADPACAAACPAGACVVREDGIVRIEAAKCLGCEYCAWVCPYGAPQYSPHLGHTTKCDLCCDRIDAGLSPACVAACPMRALDVIRIPDGAQPPPASIMRSGARALWQEPSDEHPFPLPGVSRTQPHLGVKPHPAMANGLPKAVANDEEVRRQRSGAGRRRPVAGGRRLTAAALESWPLNSGRWHLNELPLVAFTLLGQTAAGLAVISLFALPPSRSLLATMAALIAAAALLSLLHLGTVARAWRAPANARRSALSREISMLLLFAIAIAVAVVAPVVGSLALAACAVALVETMVRVYQIDVVPGWNTWRTRAAFASSALVLGSLAFLLHRGPSMGGASVWFMAAGAGVLIAQQCSARRRFYGRLRQKTM